MDNVNLEITSDGVLEIAKKAIALKTGARGLRTILENLMLDTMYEIPSEANLDKSRYRRRRGEVRRQAQACEKEIA